MPYKVTFYVLLYYDFGIPEVLLSGSLNAVNLSLFVEKLKTSIP
jgi:hypothetical protein